jgi:hypothetical protein
MSYCAQLGISFFKKVYKSSFIVKETNHMEGQRKVWMPSSAHLTA